MFITDHEVTLVTSFLLAGVAVIVPAQTFRYTRRQEVDKEARDKRADAYIRLMVAASASRESAHVQAGSIRHTGGWKIELLTDGESRMLEAQVSAFGSFEVRRLFRSFRHVLGTVLLELRQEVNLRPLAADSSAHERDLAETVRRRRQAQVAMDAALRQLEERVLLELQELGTAVKLKRRLSDRARKHELTPQADTSE